MMLAGGTYMAADAYSQNQVKQREFKLEQKGAEAENLRKQNYARFKVDIDKQGYKDKAAIDFDSWEKKEGIKEGNKDSIYVDAEGRPLTKKELQEREGGAEGLESSTDFKNRKQNEASTKGAKDKRTAKIDEIEERYGKGTPKANAAIDALYGISVSERKGDADLARKFLYNVDKKVSEYVEEKGTSEDLASILAFESGLRSTDEATDKAIRGTKQARLAGAVKGISSQFPADTTERNLRKQYEAGEFFKGKNKKTGKMVPLGKEEFELALEYFKYKNEVPESKWYVLGD